MTGRGQVQEWNPVGPRGRQEHVTRRGHQSSQRGKRQVHTATNTIHRHYEWLAAIQTVRNQQVENQSSNQSYSLLVFDIWNLPMIFVFTGTAPPHWIYSGSMLRRWTAILKISSCTKCFPSHFSPSAPETWRVNYRVLWELRRLHSRYRCSLSCTL